MVLVKTNNSLKASSRPVFLSQQRFPTLFGLTKKVSTFFVSKVSKLFILKFFKMKLVSVGCSASLLLSLLFCHPGANAQQERNFKKGLTIKHAKTCAGLEKHTSSSWWYSWGTQNGFQDGSFCTNSTDRESIVANARAQGMEFVPMLWGRAIPTVIAGTPAEDNFIQGKYVIAFNEPDKAGQANLNGIEAAELWPQVEEIASTYGLKIVGPCPTQDSTLQWYRHWQGNCTLQYGRPCHFDYSCTHLYYLPEPCRHAGTDLKWQCLGENSGRAMKVVNDLAAEYGKKVWVTEYSCAFWCEYLWILFEANSSIPCAGSKSDCNSLSVLFLPCRRLF